jgi:phenolic acid decarboxylase
METMIKKNMVNGIFFPNGSYKGGTFKGIDLTMGNQKQHCGILIRSMYDVKNQKMICGPCNCVNELLKNHGSSNVKEFMADKPEILDVIDNDFIKLKDCKMNAETIYAGNYLI